MTTSTNPSPGDTHPPEDQETSTLEIVLAATAVVLALALFLWELSLRSPDVMGPKGQRPMEVIRNDFHRPGRF